MIPSRRTCAWNINFSREGESGKSPERSHAAPLSFASNTDLSRNVDGDFSREKRDSASADTGRCIEGSGIVQNGNSGFVLSSAISGRCVRLVDGPT